MENSCRITKKRTEHRGRTEHSTKMKKRRKKKVNPGIYEMMQSFKVIEKLGEYRR